MSDSDASEAPDSSRAWRRWVAGAVLLAFFGGIMWEVINPYRGQRFERIPHGDHVHYVPKDRNEDVSVSRFPTRKPEPDERITPTGEVVPARSTEAAP